MTEHENPNPTTWSPPAIPEETVIVSPGTKRRPVAYLAVLIGLVAMAGGAVFFARSFGSAEGGADTPAAAVQRLFDALGDEDALGMLETLLPSERDVLIDPLQDVTRELGRLGILRENLDLGAIPGIELEFSGLKFSAEQIAPGVSVVELEAGTVNYTVDPAKSPLGDFVRRFMSEEDNEVISGSDSISDPDEGGSIATIERDGKWYVSLWYTAAEEARRSAGAPVPPFGNGIAARGAGSPEAAVEEFIRSAVLLDVRRLIELTPPEEMRALHDYAPLFIDTVEAGAREARKHYSAEVSVLKLAGSQSGDTALVKIDDLEFNFEIPEFGVSAEYDGQCATLRGEFFGPEPIRQCGNGLRGLPVPGFPALETPEIGFVAVREDGAWYVSPTRTILDGLVATLKIFDRKDLDTFVQIFEGMSGG